MALERVVAVDSETRDVTPGGIVASAVMHIAIFVLIIVGLPTLFRPKVPEEQPIAVELVTIAPETHATRVNPNMPVPKAKPDVQPVEAAPAPVPQPKPIAAPDPRGAYVIRGAAITQGRLPPRPARAGAPPPPPPAAAQAGGEL